LVDHRHSSVGTSADRACTNRAVSCTVTAIVSFDAQLAILRIEGDEDRTTSGRRRRPFSAALTATRDVIVDLSGLTFADPSLMIDLACLAQRLRARGVVLWLAHPQPNIRTLIETVGLHRLPAVRIDGAKPAFT
jgi:anti-anti-sigma regulatory factor